ncbi:insulin-like growth factor binding protein [Anaeramoeba flamelloides]|uniref:Insulin-like growth factor binding protein n=1 Tax=Anaeramoeba flamelloides TaxID=1746091 RepID=A0ABQ8X0Q8_9EUKA|nr:insulin-like growth factor binding protein [Anaeramoeba flamelloides]
MTVGKKIPQIGKTIEKKFSCKESCQPGTYFNTKTKNCQNCTFGTYSPFDGMEFCVACPEGAYGDQVGASECTKCPPGTYNDQIGATTFHMVCKNCSAGTYAEQEGAKKCELCPQNTYQNKLGGVKCITCLDGYESSKGAVSCSSIKIKLTFFLSFMAGVTNIIVFLVILSVTVLKQRISVLTLEQQERRQQQQQDH